MLESCQKLTGTRYTLTVALLAVAFIFSPAVLSVSRPFGYLSLSLAIACSALCVVLAWVSWRRSSPLSMPSIAVRDVRAK